MTGKGRKTEYAITALRRMCIALFFCLMPVQAALSCDEMHKTPPHYASVSCQAGNMDTHAAHDKAGSRANLCCTVCIMALFFPASTSSPALQAGTAYDSLPVSVLVGIKIPPQLHPPLFS